MKVLEKNRLFKLLSLSLDSGAAAASVALALTEPGSPSARSVPIVLLGVPGVNSDQIYGQNLIWSNLGVKF
jgi:hypothetical protein